MRSKYVWDYSEGYLDIKHEWTTTGAKKVHSATVTIPTEVVEHILASLLDKDKKLTTEHVLKEMVV